MELLDNLLVHLRTLENNSMCIKNKSQKDKLYLLKSKLDRIINTVSNCSHNIQSKERSFNLNFKSDTQKNIIIHGLEKKANSKKNVELFLSSQLGISVKVKEAVQLGKDSKSLLVKLTSVGEKVSVFRNCSKIDKKLKINIVEDLSRQEREERKKLLPELIKAKQSGFTAYFRRNKLVIKEKLPNTVNNHLTPGKLENMEPDGQEPKENSKTVKVQHKHLEVSMCNEIEEDILKVKDDNSVAAEVVISDLVCPKIEEVKKELIHSVTSNVEKNRKELFKVGRLEMSKYKAHAKIVNQQLDDIAMKLDELNNERDKTLKKKQSTNNKKKLEAIKKRSSELIEESRKIHKELKTQHNLESVKTFLELDGYDVNKVMEGDISVNIDKISF